MLYYNYIFKYNIIDVFDLSCESKMEGAWIIFFFLCRDQESN